MRLFLGLALPDPVRDALEDLQTELPVGRLVDGENLHLTLVFLGELDSEAATAVHEAMERLRTPGFDLQVKGLGTFGSKTPKIAFAGISPDPLLTQLHAKTRAAIHAAGLVLPRERFRPHITLARFRGRLSDHDTDRLRWFLEDHADFAADPFPVADVVLYRSTLHLAGSIYEPLAVYPLRGVT